MITIWGRKTSINVQKVMWAVAELSLEHERFDVGGPFGGNREDNFLRMNPNGLVPTIRDGEVIAWESNTIVRYLTSRYASGHLWPTDPVSRSHADCWMDWQLTALNPAMTPLFVQLIRVNAESRNLQVIEGARKTCVTSFSILNDWLSNREFVAGGIMTIGDIPVGCAVHRWLALPIERPSMMALEGYYERLLQRPAFVEHVASIPLS